MVPTRQVPSDLPGADLVEAGLRHLAAGDHTVPALLVSIGGSSPEAAGLRRA